MENKTTYSDWSAFIGLFNETFQGRPTRLGIFERDDNVTNDYWIESDLPFGGISMEEQGEFPTIQIAVGSLDHVVKDAVGVKFILSAARDEEGVDVVDITGRTTVLRFEKT